MIPLATLDDPVQYMTLEVERNDTIEVDRKIYVVASLTVVTVGFFLKTQGFSTIGGIAIGAGFDGASYSFSANTSELGGKNLVKKLCIGGTLNLVSSKFNELTIPIISRTIVKVTTSSLGIFNADRVTFINDEIIKKISYVAKKVISYLASETGNDLTAAIISNGSGAVVTNTIRNKVEGNKLSQGTPRAVFVASVTQIFLSAKPLIINVINKLKEFFAINNSAIHIEHPSN